MKESEITRQLLLDEIRLNRAAIKEAQLREQSYVTWANLFSVLGLIGIVAGAVVIV